jgi:acetylornithine deacetylase/succinyl-diaminopimelate desuccinylase-like protein
MPDRETLARIDAYIDEHVEDFIAQLARLTNQPSVAAEGTGIAECADLVAAMLREQGFASEVMPTAGSPVVYAEGGDGEKTLLFYLHYDVQPADPLELWESPPFELTRRGDHLYARGVSDDKGHIAARMAALQAVRAVLGELPCRVKFLVEGEEEIGSISLPDFIRDQREKLAADACIWEFGGVNFRGEPTQTLGMRGIFYVELTATTASIDSHSGLAGSIFPNAAWRLVWALNTLKDRSEHILIPGFYDNVRPPSERDIELLAALPDNRQDLINTYGIKGFLRGMTEPLEIRRAGVFEPTCTICGLTSGYQGPGSKTVLPARASAKVDFRLVPDQTPDEIWQKLRAHLDAQGFDDIEITYAEGEPPGRTDPDHPFIALVNRAAEEVYGRPPQVEPMIGGSGPNAAFIEHLGVPIATAGVGNPYNHVHAPNENVRLPDFINGIKHTAHIIAAFGEG